MADRETGTVSATVADWRREAPTRLWDPSRRLLQSVRRYQALAGRGDLLSRLQKPWWVLAHRFWSVVTGAEINLPTQIEGGLLLPHPNGIVVHPDSRIGPNCLLFHQVTLAGGHDGAPILGGHVDVGAGAKILGSVRIGDHAVIGANAVVLCDVPAGCTAVGIPARILPPKAGFDLSDPPGGRDIESRPTR